MIPPWRALTGLAALALALNLLALAWLWTRPAPDPAEIPGRAPLFDVGPGAGAPR